MPYGRPAFNALLKERKAILLVALGRRGSAASNYFFFCIIRF